MKHLFSFKLYKEALKKSKLMGIGVALATIILSALYPISQLLTQHRYDDLFNSAGMTNRVSAITNGSFLPVGFLLIVATPLFFFSMFSFLTKRNESDFYHAIPFKRETVVISFSAAIYTWLWGTLIASLAVNSILWLFCNEYSFSFLLLPKLFGILAFGTLYVGGFTMLAITLTGTFISASSLFVILFGLFRVAATFFTTLLETILPYVDLSRSLLQILSMRYWFPAVLPFGYYGDMSLFESGTLWIWSVLVTIAFNVLAIYFYRSRRSETASKSAPSKRLQHLYRCAFTLPFALLTLFTIILTDDFSDGLTFGVILGLVTVLVYYLYELITTKSIKSTIKCTPYLLAIIIGCGVFTGALYGTAAVIRTESAEPEDISEFGFYSSGFGLFDIDDFFRTPEYESILTNELTVPSEEASKIISEAWKREKEGSRLSYEESAGSWHILIKRPSGRTIGRYLSLKREELNKLNSILSESKAYKEALLQLPTEKEVQSIFLSYESYTFEVGHSLWKTFREEYETLLTEEEKTQFKEGGFNSEFTTDIMLFGSGEAKSKAFNFEYYVPKKFTKTIDLLRPLIQEEMKKEFGRLQELFANLRSGRYNDQSYYFNLDGCIVTDGGSEKEDPESYYPGKSYLFFSIYLDNSFDLYDQSNQKLVGSLIDWLETHLESLDLTFEDHPNYFNASISEYSAFSFQYFNNIPLIKIEENDLKELNTILAQFEKLGYGHNKADDYYSYGEEIYS